MANPRVPFVQQMEAVECGAACLTMVLHHFRHFAPLEELREACGVSRDGVSAGSIVKAARTYNLKPRARRLDVERLAAVEGPAIIHWNMNHFVVLVKWTEEETWINDPAIGPRKVAAETFNRSFTGICIELTPEEGFEGRKRERRSLDRYLELLRSAKRPLLGVVLVALVINILGLAIPLTTQLVVDWVVRGHQHGWLLPIGLAIAGAGALIFAARWLRGRVLAAVRHFVDSTLGPQLMGHMLSLPMRFFSQRQTGDLAGRIHSVRAVRELFAERSVSLLVDAPLLIVYILLMFAYEWRLAFIVLVFAAAYVVTFLGARKPRMEAAREQIVKDVKASSELYQALHGIVTLKSAGREETAHERWLNLFVDALNYSQREATIERRTGTLLLLIQAAVPAAVLSWGTLMAIRGELTIGELLGFLFLQAAVLMPLARVIESMLRMQVLLTHVDRMDDVLGTAVEPAGERSCPPLVGNIKFENIAFRYNKFSKPILHDLSFEVHRGQKVAFVGGSGSGKSTIARLLLGLYRPDSGRILVDGHDLSEVELDGVRRQIGAVLQETTLFEGTLRENLALYNPAATLDEIVTATRAAQIHDDILRLPHGYQTRVSADGAPLSGGQRQRVALARAILMRPPILIADEATSALDTATEQAVEHYLSTRACTRLVIAHRLSTVRSADRIFVVADGGIVESGRHDELVAAGGVYAKLHASSDGDAAAPESVRDIGRERVTAEAMEPFEPLAKLSATQRAVLAAHMQRREIPAGTEIYTQGEKGQGLSCVVDGAFDVVIHEPGLEPWTVGAVGSGAVLGEVGLLDGSPASASVVCTEAASVLYLPSKAFNLLRESGDDVAMSLMLALGALVAWRIRESTKAQEELGHGGGYEHESEGQPGKHEDDSGTQRIMSMSATALGGALTNQELEHLERLGRTKTLEPGAMLFRAGDASDKSYVVLSGRIAVTLENVTGFLTVVKPGELFGEIGLFDEGTRAADCVALERTVLFELDLGAFRSLLLAGDSAARKMLRSFTHALVRVFRLGQLRRREALALNDGEQDRARRAREEAEAIAREQGAAVVLEPSDHRAPHVAATDASGTPAACVTAILRMHGRAANRAEVEQTLDLSELDPISSRNMRSLGLLVRRLLLEGPDIAAIEDPVIALFDDGSMVIVEGQRGTVLDVMDPLRSERTMSLTAFLERFTGEAFELSLEEGVDDGLGRRILRSLGRQRRSLSLAVAAAVLGQLAALATPLALSLLVGDAYAARDTTLVGLIAVGIGIILITRILLSAHMTRAVYYVRTKLDRDLLDQLTRHVLGLPMEFFEKHAVGNILERFRAFEIVRDLVGTRGIQAALDLPVLLVSLLVLTALSARMAIIAWAVSFLFVVTVAAFLPRVRDLAAEGQETAAEQQNRLLEVLRGVITLRVSGQRGLGLRRWLPSWLAELRTAAAQSRVQSLLSASLELLRILGVGSMACYGAVLLIDGELALGPFFSALAVAQAYFGSLFAISEYTVAFSRASRGVRLLAGTFSAESEQPPDALRAQPGRLRGGVTLEHVSFTYGDDAPPVIDDVSLAIAPGAKVALVGPSGSGKSTLGKLLIGLYQPRSGRILMDGKDLAQLDVRAVRQQVGTVPQDSFLFSGSIRDNLSLSAPQADLDALTEAAKRAAALDLIGKLPMGIETIVAEGGATFSGGERQRLALARALAGEPSMLLLDEATSALDNISQAHVEASLAKMACTRITIAHRLSTVIDADLIVVLERGRIVERGRHDDLLVKGGAYARLVAPQLA